MDSFSLSLSSSLGCLETFILDIAVLFVHSFWKTSINACTFHPPVLVFNKTWYVWATLLRILIALTGGESCGISISYSLLSVSLPSQEAWKTVIQSFCFFSKLWRLAVSSTPTLSLSFSSIYCGTSTLSLLEMIFQMFMMCELFVRDSWIIRPGMLCW